MSQSPPWTALHDILERIEADLARGDTDSADAAMTAAVDVCDDMQGSDIQIPPDATEALRELAARCGTSLAGLARALDAESLRDDNHRRALLTYQGSRPR